MQVRCLEDYGEFETEDGTVLLLKKNSQVGGIILNKGTYQNGYSPYCSYCISHGTDRGICVSFTRLIYSVIISFILMMFYTMVML